MMSYTAYFTSGRPSPIVSSTGSYIICKSRCASFLVNEQGIMSLFWNTVSRVKLLGRGRRYSGDVAEFSGDFCKTDIFKERSLVKTEKMRRSDMDFRIPFFQGTIFETIKASLTLLLLWYLLIRQI